MTDIKGIPFRKVTEEEVALMSTSLVGRYQVSARCLDGTDLPSLAELLSGIPFRAGMCESDAAEWAKRLLDEHKDDLCGPLPRGVVLALVRVLREQTRQTIGALRIACQRRQACWNDPFIERLVGMDQRCDVYLAAMGDTEAATRSGLAGLRGVNWRERGAASVGRLTRAIGLLAPALTEKRLCDLFHAAEVIESARTLGGVTDISAFQSAFFAEQRDAQRGRKPRPQPPVVVDDELLDAVVEDRAEGLWQRSVEHPKIVVIRSLDHLPVPTQSGISRRDSPRAEFDRIAGQPMPLAPVPDLTSIALELGRRMPWADAAVEAILMPMAGRDRAAFPPILFLGGPGAGKSTLGYDAGTLMGLQPTLYSCAGASDSAFGGTSRQWASGRASVPLQAIARTGIANPLIVLDEIEKVGTRETNGSLHQALMPMLEPATSSRVMDLYVECEVDLSGVLWIATANSLAGIPKPLLDRFRVVEVPTPGPEHLEIVAAQIVREIRTARGVSEEWLPPLAPDEIDVLRAAWPGGSIRQLRRAVQILISGRETLTQRH